LPSGSWVQETSYSIVTFVIRQLTGEWSDIVWQWFSRFFGAPVAIFDDPLVQRLVQVGIGVALGVLPVMIGWRALQEMLARMDGTSMAPPEALIRRGLTAGVAVTATSLAAWFMTSLAEQARGVLAAVGLDINLLRQFFDPTASATSTVIMLTLAFLIAALILTIQRGVLAAELTVLLVMGPVMAAGLLKEDGASTWTIWVREVTSILLTPLIQMLVLMLFIRKWGNAGGVLDIGDRLASFAFLYVLWNTPRWARQMVYSVGASGAVSSAAGTVQTIATLAKALAAL
jgi:hypothetical protein